MLLITIPYKLSLEENDLDKLKNALLSLQLQTSRYFQTLIVIDGAGDEEKYNECVQKIVSWNFPFNIWCDSTYSTWHGAGGARQAAINRAVALFNCGVGVFSHIMFLDADDMLLPNAVEDLSRAANQTGYDVIVSPLIVEKNSMEKTIMPADENTTWTHGTIYSVKFLQEHKIGFFKGIEGNEDSAFNLLANTYSRKNRGKIEIPTYLWRHNKDSITQRDPEYFAQWATPQYVIGVSKAITQLAKDETQEFDKNLIYSILELYYKDELCSIKRWRSQQEEVLSSLSDLFKEPKVIEMFEDKNVLNAIGSSLRGSIVYGEKLYIPFESFWSWVYLRSDGKIQIGG